jgi:hypothetical protein
MLLMHTHTQKLMNSDAIRSAFDQFIAADDVPETIEAYSWLSRPFPQYDPTIQPPYFEWLKATLLPHLPHKHKMLFGTIEQKWKHSQTLRQRQNFDCTKHVVISGAGPCGLRAACEAALVGFKHVTVLELRDRCSRHNILKTWQSTIDDLMGLGVSSFVQNFKPHGHLHLGTRELQLCLLKAGLLLGVKYRFGIGTCQLLSPDVTGTGKWAVLALPHWEARQYLMIQGSATGKDEPAELALKSGEQDTSRLQKYSKVDFYEKAESEEGAIWRQTTGLSPKELEALNNGIRFEFDALVIAEGESSRMIRRLGFDRKVAKYNEAIGIVVNLDFSPYAKTKEGLAERQLKEFVVLRSAADWKQGPLGRLVDLGLDLENMEYMRGTSTHFIAATTKLKVLLDFGIIKSIGPTVRETLTSENIGLDKLHEVARILAHESGLPKECPLSSKHGVQVFDYSCKGVCTDTLKKLDDGVYVFPAGDALQNPYWPQGLGVNRGFHNALDAVWAAYLSACHGNVEEERRFAFKIMEWKPFWINVVQTGKGWALDPCSRYGHDLVKAIHMHDIETKASQSSIPKRYRDALGIRN